MRQLDSLRALAAFAVVLHHAMPASFQKLRLGEAGVQLFFVLSGFLITGILLNAKEQAHARGVGHGRVMLAFYARRFLRIFPLYFLVLFVALFLNYPYLREEFPWHVAYLSNWRMGLTGEWMGSLGHFWSLAVEEQFYLVWPVVVLLVPTRRLLPVLLGVVLLSPVFRFILTLQQANSLAFKMLPFCCLDTLAAGALLALVRHREKKGEKKGTGTFSANFFSPRFGKASFLLGLGLFLVLAALREHGSGWRYRMILLYTPYMLMCPVLIDRAARGFDGIARRILEWQPLVYLGTISYGIYVYHGVLPTMIESIEANVTHTSWFPTEPGLLMFVWVSIATVIVSALSWRFFEKPLNDLKSWFPYVQDRKATRSESHALDMECGDWSPLSDFGAAVASGHARKHAAVGRPVTKNPKAATSPRTPYSI
jgi:peptidoglycan/LPS O-acetylase OafA/YrhL